MHHVSRRARPILTGLVASVAVVSSGCPDLSPSEPDSAAPVVELIANPSIAIERAGSLGVSATARDLVLPPGEKVAYHWIWGDKSKSVTPTGRAAHTYTAPGTYQVAVYAVDAAGAVVATAESEVSIED